MAKSIGLYEEIITESIAAELRDIGEAQIKSRRPNPAELGDRLALHISRIVQRTIDSMPKANKTKLSDTLTRSLIEKIQEVVAEEGLLDEIPREPTQVLSAILSKNPDGSIRQIEQPLIPLLDTTLLTNAPGEPRVGAQVLTEIASADRIDIVMAFIMKSGIRPFLAALKRHCEKSSRFPNLRILTTTYTGTTKLDALKVLRDLGAEIKVSYDLSTARLHAKAWHFHRESGASTAYIGSSNLTHSAQVTGMEWNVRLSAMRNPDVFRKLDSVFEAYWAGDDFRTFDEQEFRGQTKVANPSSTTFFSPIELRLEPFQERLLEQIKVARLKGQSRNLLVSATGTGKTVMAAVDYKRLASELKRSRLLFVAHRIEILEQSRSTFRFALRETDFGELWVGGRKPQHFEHVFASIQSLNANDLATLASDHFDVVIIDEFHHAGADSYEKLLDHLQPVQLLGLTATPERTDGRDILPWFEGKISAELRLWDAIDQHRLVPFTYFGINDGMDLSAVPWQRGRGYEVAELTNLYTSTDAWVKIVYNQLIAHIDDIQTMQALGFCVSVKHAEFMAYKFDQLGISAIAVSAATPATERQAALQKLRNSDIQIIFSVDLYNEGIDIPTVDTLLLLRPTESGTLFLQQLGRGLRKSYGKSMCTVLDFVGQHRTEFRFDHRLRALIGGTRKQITEQVQLGFPYLPAGCHMELDAVVKERILSSLKNAIAGNFKQRVAELQNMIALGIKPTIKNFLEHTGLVLPDIYAGNRCWSDFLDAANLSTNKSGPKEKILRRAVGRMLHVDDEERLKFYSEILDSPEPPDVNTINNRRARLVRMLIASLMTSDTVAPTDNLEAGLKVLWNHSQVIRELIEVFSLLRGSIDHLHSSLSSHNNIPLQVHAKYSRIEILAACGPDNNALTPSWREGVKWIEGEKVDLLAFTLDKSSGGFSPTTSYRDYAISSNLIHWESQSNTRADSPTGKRYQNHIADGSSVFLFARENTDERAYWFLGPATFVKYQSERPMGITWRLAHSLPGDLFAKFAAAVA
ncbi:MAG: superfamily II DNA or RNA helicase/HKD family nuclease [Candidatus Azotimanducaceae bacterium]|jgi:superfamily II DNA or RNA helicase/HKD family nuclease